MPCKQCNSTRFASVSAECDDRCYIGVGVPDHIYKGYVPDDMGIGGVDYVQFAYCLDCGQIVGTWPKPITHCEREAHKKRVRGVVK